MYTLNIIIWRHAFKVSLVFSCKMLDRIICPLAKFKSSVWKFFGFPQVKVGGQGDDKDEFDNLETMQS